MKITVTKKANGKWLFSINKSSFSRKNATFVFKGLERKLKGKESAFLASHSKVKTCLVIKSGRSIINEAECDNLDDFFFTLACFLEDWLKPEHCIGKQKKYRPEVFLDSNANWYKNRRLDKETYEVKPILI